jgi:hypothetical protein
VRGTDICCRSHGVIVQVPGGRAPRAAPVLAPYHATLLEAAALAGQYFLTGGTEPGRGNITNPLIRSLAGGGGLPPLDTSRLRAAWLADVAQLLGLPVFLHAAGITCSQRLGDIIAGLDRAGDEEHAVTLPGGIALGDILADSGVTTTTAISGPALPESVTAGKTRARRRHTSMTTTGKRLLAAMSDPM